MEWPQWLLDLMEGARVLWGGIALQAEFNPAFRIILYLIGACILRPENLLQARSYVADGMLENVVTIVIGGDRGGLGFIIGRNGDILWVATAAHVVFTDLNHVPPVAAREISVKRRNDPTAWALAGPPQPGLGEGDKLDLAFIPVRMPLQTILFDRWREPVVDDAPAIGDAVRIAGQPGRVAYDDRRGKIGVVDGQARVVDLQGGQGGQSGAPIATSRGFVGMYLSAAGERAMPIAQVRQAAIAAQLPWTLVSVGPRATPMRLCLKVTGLTPSAVRVNSDAGIRQPDADGCLVARSGAATIYSNDPAFRCKPNRLNLPSTAEFHLPLQCAPELESLWYTADYGILRITRTGENRWRFTGLDMSPYGGMNGTINLVPQGLAVAGQSTTGAQVNGMLRIDGGRLKGRLLVGPNPPNLELAR